MGRDAYLLCCRGVNFEVGWDVTPEDTCLKSFDVSTNVRLRRQQMSFIHIALLIQVFIRHDDVATECFNLDANVNETLKKRDGTIYVPSGESHTAYQNLSGGPRQGREE
jgi:hypothetical protein